MPEKDSINLDELVLECKIDSPELGFETIALIEGLSNRFEEKEMVTIYNHFFDISSNYDVLMFLIKKINEEKNLSSVDLLIDTLIMKDKFKDRITDADARTKIRVMVAKTLANLKDNRAVYPLLYCLNNKDENYKIRLSCAEALGKIGDKYAVTPLVDLLEDESESSVYIKESAAFALGMIGDTKAVESLVSILETKKGLIDKFTFLKERAIEALNKINPQSDRVLKAFKNSLMDESIQVRINAIEGLMNIGSIEALELIKGMLKDREQEVVKNAVIALFNLEGEEILARIIHDPESTELARDEANSLLSELSEDDDDCYE